MVTAKKSMAFATVNLDERVNVTAVTCVAPFLARDKKAMVACVGCADDTKKKNRYHGKCACVSASRFVIAVFFVPKKAPDRNIPVYPSV